MSERPHEYYETEESRQLRERYNRKNADPNKHAKEPLEQSNQQSRLVGAGRRRAEPHPDR